MSYADQNAFFALAYRTGTDRWSNIPFNRRAHELALLLPKDAMVLDIGAGRGKLLFELEELGFKAIGLDNNPELVASGNQETKNKKVEHRVRFLEGDVLAMPLADQSFDAAVDIGLLPHIKPDHFEQYFDEIARVLKHDGYFFLVALAKETPKYFTWHPRDSEVADYALEGVRYHFFTDEELRSLAGKHFEIQSLEYDHPYGPGDTIYSVLLLKKK